MLRALSFVVLLLALNGTIYADFFRNKNNTKSEESLENLKRLDQVETIDANKEAYELQKQEIEAIDAALANNDLWSMYDNFFTYQSLKKQLLLIDAKKEQLEKQKNLNKNEKTKLDSLLEQHRVATDKLQLLAQFEKDPKKTYLSPPEIVEAPHIGNPFAIIGALSYKKQIKQDGEEYAQKGEELVHIVELLQDKLSVLTKLKDNELAQKEVNADYAQTKIRLKAFEPALDIYKTTSSVHDKKLLEVTHRVEKDIENEVEKAVTLGAIILFFLLLLFGIKYFMRKYLLDNDKYYAINKAINFGFIGTVLFLLLLFYIENVSYLVTILGFASAGIAFALKDWFMSIMGWMYLMLGGSIHVGDRIRVMKDGMEYVGDVIDVSMLRMTLHEDVTLVTDMVNRRAGRIVFIPNHYVFTSMIANYAHSGLKTVWDGIDFMVTFDSNIHRATQIAKEAAKQYSKGYTDITRKQLNKLRSHYHMKNTNVEPRIFTSIEPYGMRVTVWYLTNSYATLTLRSTISNEIVRQINLEENIHIAYPSQSIFVDKYASKPPVDFKGEGNEPV